MRTWALPLLLGPFLLTPLPLAAQRRVQEFAGHTDPVYSVAYGQQGRLVVTAGLDQTVRLWDAAAGTALTTYNGHRGIVLTAVFSPDGTLIASGALDNSIKLWDVPSREPTGEFAADPAGLQAAGFSADGSRAASVGKDGTLRLHDVTQSTLLHEAPLGEIQAGHVSFRRDGQRFVIGDDAGRIHVYQTEDLRRRTILGAHRGGLVAVEYTPNSAYLLTCGQDGYVRRWPASLAESRVFEDVPQQLSIARLDASGNRLLVASNDKTVAIWDVGQGRLQRELAGHQQTVAAADFTSDGGRVATGGAERIVRLFQTGDGQQAAASPELPGQVTVLAFRRDNRVLAVGTDTGTVLLLQADDLATTQTLTGHTGPVTGLTWNADGKQLYSVSRDKTLRTWNAADGSPNGQIELASELTGLTISRDAKQLAVAAADGTIAFLAPGAAEPERTLPGDGRPAVTLDFNNNGERLIAGYDDSRATVWDLKQNLPLQHFVEQSGSVLLAGFRPDQSVVTADAGGGIVHQQVAAQWVVDLGDQQARCLSIAENSGEFAVGTESGEIRVLNVSNGQPGREFSALDEPVRAVSFSANNSYFAAGGDAGTINLWRIGNRQRIDPLQTPAGVRMLAFSRDGRQLLAGGGDGVIRSYTPDAGTRASSGRPSAGPTPTIQELAAPHNGVLCLQTGSDLRTAFTAGKDGRLRTWSLASADAVATLSGHRGQVYAVAFSPDGATLVSASSDKTLRLWDAVERKPIRELARLDGVPYAVAFLPDGKSVVSAGADRVVQRFDLESGRELQRYSGSDEALYTVDVSPDGRRIAAAGTGLGTERSILIWSLDGSQPELTLRMSTDSIYRVQFDATGDRLLAVGYDGTVTVFDAATRKPLAELKLPTILYDGVFAPDGQSILLATGANEAWRYELPQK